MCLKWSPLINPIFILSPIRSGSTLLRCLLNEHKEIYAPHEFHLSFLKVSTTIKNREYLLLSLKSHHIKLKDLNFVLWDRIYHMLLSNTQKNFLVDKSPSNLKNWLTIRKVWPNSKFILLIRDPSTVVRSVLEAQDGRNMREIIKTVCKSFELLYKIYQISQNYILIKYEDLTEDSENTLKKICLFLQINYNSDLLKYNIDNSDQFIYGIGDWQRKIKSGKILKPNKEGINHNFFPRLLEARRKWGYI